MSTTPVNVQIPSDAEAPVIADFVEHALRVAYVNRAHLSAMPASDWDVPGVYVLLTDDGSGHVYVGQARRMRTRLSRHNGNEKLPWRRAVAVKRDTTDGFNTAEIGYLEGRVSAEVAALDDVTAVEGRSSGDETLPKHMMLSLDSFVKSILAALRLANVNTTRPNPETEPEDRPVVSDGIVSRATFAVKFGDLVSSGLLRAGETLFLKQGGTEAQASVTADGEIVVHKVAYKSPSSAAAKALGLQSSNGWVTWRVGSLTGPTLDALRQELLAQQRAEGQR
ncbi:restriction system modified-DNA reader domain-containing protein [Actinoalloteichus hymeniacidonis]|uniref:RAMA domain-containing protein n=1 Tax=Actinoalloteichus hymeniacidonis TaxID=340345 RepID=A0AAC9MXR0_9PSEU|nr:excinuclease ABC subunit C [Actinoalloteichus hymeniacidonis]AOS62609.1 hypothetical protein TL08_08970 [Actinoalloteichus hymeniacidonis]MBB5909359.1 hypothetical protein [Actinoalloteichus hymeniacidonis]